MGKYTLCPACRGKHDECALCDATGRVAYDVSAAYFEKHPEARKETTGETPADLED